MKSPLISCLLLMMMSLAWAQTDVSDSQDHPLITRYPGAEIHWYEEQTFETYQIAIGPETGYRYIADWLPVQGKLTRIFYSIPGKRSMSEVYLNYQSALKKGGFSILAQGSNNARNVSKEVGGRSWMNTAYAKNPLPAEGKITLFHGTPTTGGSGYLAGELKRSEGTVYVTVAVYQHNENEVVVLVDVIEAEALEDDLITVDPDAMSSAIDRDGKVLIYGLNFEFDQATLMPESKVVLDAIAQLLRQRPQLQLYVVGHTDWKGELNYNLRLSEARAMAVIEALVKDYGIERSRLSAQGVGPLVPVSTNQNDNGRSLNRRVELVEK